MCQAACFSSPGSLSTWGTVFPSVFSVGGGFGFLAACRDCQEVSSRPSQPAHPPEVHRFLQPGSAERVQPEPWHLRERLAEAD